MGGPFRYAGVENGDECYCGNADDKFIPTDPGECNIHALAIKINSVAARGVCKYMIPDYSKIKNLTIPNIQKLQ